MPAELTEDERHALINMLTVEIEQSRYPLSPHIELLKRIRAKLRGEEPAPGDTDASKRKPRR